MKNPKSIASLLIFAGSVLCFFLPFVTVSCAGIKVGTFTGQQLATGVHPSESVPGISVNTQGYNGDPLTAVAFLCAIAGVGLSLAGRKLAAVTAASGGVGGVALLIMRARLTDQIQAQIVGQIQTQLLGQGQGIVQVNFEPGLMFAVSLLAAGAALNLYALFHREENAAAAADAGAGVPTDSSPVSGAGDAAGSISSSPPGWKAASEPQIAAQVQARAGSAARVARFCRHCGTPVSEGKRFCSQCGSEIAQRQDAPKPKDLAFEETPSPAPTVIPEVTAPPTAAAVFAPTAPVAPLIASAAEPARAASQYVEPVPVETSFEPDEETIVAVPARRSGLTVWLVTAIAGVLVISAAAFWIYEWHRGTTLASLFGRSNTSESATSPQVPPQPQAQVQPQPQAPNPESEVMQRPSPSEPGNPSSPPVTVTTGGPPITNPISNPTPDTGSGVVSTPSNHQNQPPPPTNGMLHYSGPPVHFGETVTFTGLPGGMLRFTFDHSAWQPLISRQPDGTQTLTLRSLMQDVQTQCDVAWVIVQ